jgi:drug/metabolite transporter (DMT)-like permease
MNTIIKTKIKTNLKISPYLIALFAISIFIDVAVLLAEKIAAQDSGQILGKEINFFGQLLQQPWTWFSFALTAAQFVIWRNLLKYVQLTFACCVSSIAYPLTTLAAVLLFKGNIQTIEWLGIALITGGIVLANTGKARI